MRGLSRGDPRWGVVLDKESEQEFREPGSEEKHHRENDENGDDSPDKLQNAAGSLMEEK